MATKQTKSKSTLSELKYYRLVGRKGNWEGNLPLARVQRVVGRGYPSTSQLRTTSRPRTALTSCGSRIHLGGTAGKENKNEDHFFSKAFQSDRATYR